MTAITTTIYLNVIYKRCRRATSAVLVQNTEPAELTSRVNKVWKKDWNSVQLGPRGFC